MKLVKIFKEMLKEAEYTQGTFDFDSKPEYGRYPIISNIEDLNKFLSDNSGKEFEGSIDLKHNQSITSLPKGLKVKGDVNLFDCSKLESLPSDLEVGGVLNIISTPLAKKLAEKYKEEEMKAELKKMLPNVSRIISKYKIPN
jgi:hypothetical protein